MTDTIRSHAVRRAETVVYESTEADGLEKGSLIGEDDGAPNFAMRRFRMAPSTTVPRHTNEVEHVQYVLEGGYVAGIGNEEYELEPGDSLYIPAGEVHGYRTNGDTHGSFICVVPHGEDELTFVE